MQRLMTCFLAALVLVAPMILAAVDNGIIVRDGYVRGLPPGVRNTAAYMTIINHGDTDLVLTGATSTVADSVMLHTTVNRNGKISMEHVMSAVVPAGGELVLKSGGYHLMLMGLHRNLQSGDTVKLSLQFSGAVVIPLELTVVSVLDE